VIGALAAKALDEGVILFEGMSADLEPAAGQVVGSGMVLLGLRIGLVRSQQEGNAVVGALGSSSASSCSCRDGAIRFGATWSP
jgi:hypothetical protein